MPLKTVGTVLGTLSLAHICGVFGVVWDTMWIRSGSIFFFLTKQRQNPFVEGTYSGADYEDVECKWEATKLYFQDYKKDCTRPPSIDLAMALHGFGIDNIAAQSAIDGSKALHARRWQMARRSPSAIQRS